MKQSITIILLVIILNSLAAKSPSFFSDLSLRSTYSNNILKLSEYDLDKFDEGDDSGKFKLETTDDLIISPKLEIGWKNYFLAGHTQIIKFSFNYDKYLQNEIKDGLVLGLNLKQFLNKKMNFTIGYLYSPDIFVNRYKSVLGDESIYRDFTYSKNYYYGRFHYKLLPKVLASYRLGISQLYYNKYFTEYDATGWQHLFTIRLIPAKFIRCILDYEFKVSTSQAEDSFDFPYEISVIKDGSYEANIYTAKLEFPKITQLMGKDISGQVGIEYEQRYFQSEYELDEYHFARDDYIFSLKSSLEYSLTKKMALQLTGSYEERNTDSPFSVVERDKSYKLIEAGINIQISLDKL